MNVQPVKFKIYKAIDSCKTPEQIKTCLAWALDLARRDYLTETEYKSISGRAYFKWRELHGPMDQGLME